MNAEEKLTQQRLSLLELAEALGSVSEACRRRGAARYACTGLLLEKQSLG